MEIITYLRYNHINNIVDINIVRRVFMRNVSELLNIVIKETENSN